MSRKQATTDETFSKSQHWCRLTLCLNGPVKDALIAVLHNFINNSNINALPSDPTQLYNFMVTNQNKLMKLEKNKVLKQDQLNQLLPQEGKVSSNELDITLLRLLIKTFSGILNEDGNWREPRHDDHSIAAAVFRAVNIRNKVFHYANPISMSDQEFDDIWCQIEKTLLELFYVEDISDYKTQDFDPILCKQFHSNMAEDFENILLAYQEKCKNRDVSEYFVKRKYENVSNKREVSNIDKLLKNHESIMVSGEAGLGKTFSAKKMRYLWASGEILKKKKLLYIDSKRVNKYMYKPSNAAPICVSELGDVVKDKPDEYLESFGCVKKPIKDLVVIIDGVDELSIKENNLDLDFLNKLQVKIDKNNDISAMETIIGIYFGLFFPGSKIIAFGRKNEVARLQDIQDQLQQSNLFNKRTRAVLELLPLNEKGVKELISRATCNKISCNCEKCAKTYTSVRDVEFRNVPSHLIAMIRIFKYLPDTNFGRITKTKIFIITIFNLLKNHTQTVNLKDFKTFKKFFTYDKTNEFRECIQQIAKISFLALLHGEVTIKVEQYNKNDVDYLKYDQIYKEENICITMKHDILEQLDFFYIRDLEYYVILEPYHLTNMEFLASCYIYCFPDEWDLLLELGDDRKPIVLSYIAGLYSKENFTKDFVSEVLHDNSNQDIQNYLSWLFSIDVRQDLPKGIYYVSKEDGQLFPPFELLNMISKEVDSFEEISKRLEDVKTVAYYDDSSPLFDRQRFDHDLLNLFGRFEKCNIVVKRSELNICITKGLGTYITPDIHQYKSKGIIIKLSKRYRKYFNFRNSEIPSMRKSDSRTLDLFFNALLISTTASLSEAPPVIDCKYLKIENIDYLNDQLTEKLFSTVLSGVVDYISLENSLSRCSSFFSDRQLEILKNMESMYTNKLMNIAFSLLIDLKNIFDLPKLGNRHIYCYCSWWIDEDLIALKQHISPVHSNNFSEYKIIDHHVPFIRKKNYTRDSEQSMYLVLNCNRKVDFENVLPIVFADVLSLIPSLACNDNKYLSPHWMSLSLKEECRINELRIWYPQPKNFELFLKIKTNILQFICESENDLKELLDHIVKNENMQLDKEIKVFVVKFDEFDWDCYEEKTLFSYKTIEEFKLNYSSYDLQLERHVKKWCCEISLPFQLRLFQV